MKTEQELWLVKKDLEETLETSNTNMMKHYLMLHIDIIKWVLEEE